MLFDAKNSTGVKEPDCDEIRSPIKILKGVAIHHIGRLFQGYRIFTIQSKRHWTNNGE